MGKRRLPASTAHHLAFNPSPKIVELRCGLADRSRQTWSFDAKDHIGCPGCLIWIARNGSGFIDWQARALAAEALINAPEIVDFTKAVQLEAAHQRTRWGSDHDAGKADADWFWLIGYLGGKALRADDGIEKQLHRIITVAAAACNWHAAKLGQTNMRPGIETPKGPCATCFGIHGNPPCPGTGRAPVPDECDIDDLPDCLVGGVHQPHCRHAGKPVTPGGNP